MELASLRGGMGKVGVPTPGGTPPGLENERRMCLAFPLPTRAPGTCWAPGPGPLPSRIPSSRTGPRGVGVTGGEEEERQTGRGPPGPEDQGRMHLMFLLPTRAPVSLLGF